jgi:iron complex outermembrane receptor protein
MLVTTSATAAEITDLQEVTVYAQTQNDAPSVGGTAISQEELRRFDRDTLDTAVELAAGTSISEVGARNETDVWIRGFDRWRVPLYQDGIPIYLPVDNRVDYGRFTTLDLSSIQISKGFASVIDGPGAMGGAINLVSRIAAKPLDFDARIGTRLDSAGRYEGWTSDLFAGSRQGNWFAQAAGSFDTQSHFRLSNDFVAGTLQGPGDRIESSHRDYKVNLKAGYAPSDAAEYSLNFIDQMGEKGNPPPDGIIPPGAKVNYWTWPAWDKQSGYWLSKNVLDDRGSYLKTRLYYDRFYNQLDSFDTISYSTQNLPKSFDSTYDDRAAGGSVELDENLPGGADTVRLALHDRWDEHNETESTRNAPAAPWYQQPWEKATEVTSSLAAENIFHADSHWDLIAGASYDYRRLIGDSQWVASGSATPFGSSFAYPVANKHALNGELAALYRYSDSGSLNFSYADRARFPTLFEMYSTRFGTFRNNPDLGPERSHYAQIGITDTIAGTLLSADVFSARIDDAINAVALSPTLSESENTGAERHDGYEVELSRALLPTLRGGMNYSYLARVVLSGSAVPTDTPNHKFFGFLEWRPVAVVAVVPTLDIEGRRWLQSATNPLTYYRGGDFAMLNLKVSYQPSEMLQAEIGSKNVSDQNYLIEDGYHAPGREYFANIRVTL